MCGIVGYIGKGNATDVVLDALGRLEYRGYDSAGVAVLNSKGVEVRKCVGKLPKLAEALRQRPMTGSVGIGHCLVGETLIQLADGRAVRIDSLTEETIVIALDPATLKITSRVARAWSHPAPAQLIELQTPFGVVVCTPQHRMLIADDEGRLVERMATALRPGDLLVHLSTGARESCRTPITFRTVSTPRYYHLGDQTRALIRSEVARVGGSAQAAVHAGVSTTAIGHLWESARNASETVLRPLTSSLGIPFPPPGAEPVNSRHGSFIELPRASSPELMQWLGYLLGDGHVGRRGIRFKDPDLDTLRTYQGFSQRLFNVRGRIMPIPDVRAHLLELNSIGLANWVRFNVLSRRQQFLDDVGSLPAAELAAFLRGIFDAEGYAARQAGQVALLMVDREFVRRMQLWLLQFDIIASLTYEAANARQQRPHPALRLLVTRHDALTRFQEAIGFSSARKRAWLAKILTSKRAGFYLSSRAIPMRPKKILQWLKAAGVSSPILRRFRSGRRFTDGQAEKLLQALGDFPQATGVAECLRGHLQADVRSQEILSVRHIPSNGSRVYDLEVEGVENFFANGILSHNSRWATHGEPTEANAHPHTDCSGKIAVIHNGIIENYAELKEQLCAHGHTFRSQTDTEVIAHLVEELKKRHPIDEAFRRALKELKGSYAVCLLDADAPDRLFGARNSSPLIVGVGEGEAFFASDVPAVLPHTRRVVYLNDNEAVELTSQGPRLRTLDGKLLKRRPVTVTWDIASARKGGFPHFMLKEIHEQPSAIEQTLYNRLDPSKGHVGFDRRTNTFLSRLAPDEKLVIIACGTAYHAGLVGEYMLEEIAGIPVDVDLASEFRYRGTMVDHKTTVIAITQSGETADTLAGVRLARAQGAKVLSICNVMGSSIARESDAVLYTHAGPEIAVASTKAYTAQLTALLLLTLSLAKRRRRVPIKQWTRLIEGLAQLPKVVEQTLEEEATIKAVAAKYATARNFYYLGRRYHYPSALEGALKLKEICPLIHAEGYAAGEMKHGPISLIHKGWPVVFLATQSPVYEKVISNIEEVRARKGECIVIASEGDETIKRYADTLITVPKTEELFSPIVAAIPLQLFAYYVADANGCDIDQPPNLAKSVTVE